MTDGQEVDAAGFVTDQDGAGRLPAYGMSRSEREALLVESYLENILVPVLERRLYLVHELVGDCPIHHAVVVAEGQVHH